MLEILTFTGVDEATDLSSLKDICSQYPQVEFAVLYGSHPGEGNPIFPSTGFIQKFRALQGVRTAIHLCGRWARSAAGELERSITLGFLCSGFGRVQINLHGDDYDPKRVELQHSAIKRFAEQTLTNSVILQHQGTFETVPIKHPRFEYLLTSLKGAAKRDSSSGRNRPPTQESGTPTGWDLTTSKPPCSS